LTICALSSPRHNDGGSRIAKRQLSSRSGFRDRPHTNGGIVQVMWSLQDYEEGASTGISQDSKPGATRKFRALTNSSSRRQKALRRFAVKFSGSAA